MIIFSISQYQFLPCLKIIHFSDKIIFLQYSTTSSSTSILSNFKFLLFCQFPFWLYEFDQYDQVISASLPYSAHLSSTLYTTFSYKIKIYFILPIFTVHTSTKRFQNQPFPYFFLQSHIKETFCLLCSLPRSQLISLQILF